MKLDVKHWGVSPRENLNKEQRLEKRRKRALSRWFQGSQGEPMLLVTLTTPEPEGSESVDIHQIWRLFMWRCRRHGIWKQYYVVKEYNEKRTCVHLHAVFRVHFLDAVLMRHLWTASVRAVMGDEVTPEDVWTHHDKVWGADGMGAYLGKYLAKGLTGQRMYWYSKDWVFRRYVAYSKAIWSVGYLLEHSDILLLRLGAWERFRTLYLCWRRGVFRPGCKHEKVFTELEKCLSEVK